MREVLKCESSKVLKFGDRVRGENEMKKMGVIWIRETVVEVVTEQLGVTPEQIMPGARFNEDLGADSLDCIEIAMAFEGEFGIEIPEAVYGSIRTVGEAVDYLTARVG